MTDARDTNHDGVNVLDATQVMEQELEYVARRRDADDAGVVRQSLVGLALSGGGIRSATFGLGVLEGLKEHGLLERIDYLSTVSGGGYIGGWLSANCVRAAQREAPVSAAERGMADEGASEAVTQRDLARANAHMPWLAKDANWTLSIDHLRRYSNYLSPILGLFSADTWSMITIWLRNTLLVQATVISVLAVLLLLPRLSMELFSRWPDTGHLRWATVIIFIFAVAGIAANLLQLSRGESHAIKARHSRYSTPAAVGLIIILAGLLRHWDLDLFAYGAVPFERSLIIALLATGAGFLLLPLGVQAANLWRTDKPFKRVNYTQGWVQFAVVVPMIATGFLIAAVLWGQAGNSPFGADATFAAYLRNQWRYWPFPLHIALASLWLFAYCSLCPRKGNPGIDALEKGHAYPSGRLGRIALILWVPLPALLVFYVAICALLQLLRGWHEADPQKGIWLALMWVPTLTLFAFALSIVVLIGMLGRSSLESVREWWSRLGAWLSIYGIAWLGISLAAILGPRLLGVLNNELGWPQVSAAAGWLLTTAGGLLAARSNSTGGEADNPSRSKTDVLKSMLAAVGPVVFIAGLLVIVAAALHQLVLSTAEAPAAALAGSDYWRQISVQSLPQLLWMLGAGVALAWVLSARVDINVFNLNAFYRNRLVRCYLGAARFLKDERTPQNFIGLDENDDFPMRELGRGQARGAAPDIRGDAPRAAGVAAEVPPGPLHIVNCALNLGGSSDLALHTRHSASFIITPYAVGSGYRGLDAAGNPFPVGYRAISEYGGRAGYPTLGQAIAVSGAAASPNMGYHTAPTASFLLTLFNARLGWWFPAPARPITRSSPGQSLLYLAKELFGLADERSPFLNVSDGGHFENLAAYELVRRQCRIIIVSDAECDPGLQCEGLARLIRMCKVDFDAELTIDVSAIRTSGAAWSRDRCAVGEIIYNASSSRSPRGKLIYIKAAMTGHEDTAILQYKATHPAFPHESTGNQFYGEDQFESYRHLGKEITAQVFRRVIPKSGEVRSWSAIGEDLLAIWAPNLTTSAQFTGHSKILMDLWNRLASDPDLQRLDKLDQHRLASDWPDGSVPEEYLPVYYLCMQIIQLMENVYLDLDFEKTWDHVDNEGWQETFRNWTMMPAVRKTWDVSAATFGWRFQYFCNRHFDLPMLPRTSRHGG